MKQIWITRPGSYDVLEVKEAPDPEPGAGEVLLDVKASGLNFSDIIARMGKYGGAPPIPCVVGYEVAGVVRSVGTDVTRHKPGDRVFGITRFGGHSSVVVAPENQFFGMPDKMDFAAATAMPVNYFTAYLAAIRMGNLQPNERLLIHNAGGGVGIAAVQIARRIGAEVYGTASPWKHARLKELGVTEAIDYRTGDWVKEVQRRSNGVGAHVILDSLGGRNLTRDLEVLAPFGRLVGYGFSEPMKRGTRPFLSSLRSMMGMPRPHYIKLLSNNWAISGLNLAHLWGELDRLSGAIDDILTGWTAGALTPIVHATLPFEEAGEAHRILQERENFGKVVLVPSD